MTRKQILDIALDRALEAVAALDASGERARLLAAVSAALSLNAIAHALVGARASDELAAAQDTLARAIEAGGLATVARDPLGAKK